MFWPSPFRFLQNRNSLNQDPCTVGSMLDASCRGIGGSTPHGSLFCRFYLLPETYNYPPVNASESYRPPRVKYPDDLDCDCNSVMYKYEVQTLKEEYVLICLESLHGVCHVSGRLGFLVRPRTATHLRYLLTAPSRFEEWLPVCTNVYISQ